MKTAASRLVAGLKELWKGYRTSYGAESEGGSTDRLVSSLADYFNIDGETSDDESNSRCRHTPS